MRADTEQVRVPNWGQQRNIDDQDDSDRYNEREDFEDRPRNSSRGGKRPNFLMSIKDKLVNIISESEDDEDSDE